jgi:ABC-type uncharacterized transport system auxiliary subunit
MNNKINKPRLCLALIVLSIIILGCGQKSYNKHYYLLDVSRDMPVLEKQNDVILQVQRFTIDSAFESKGLVYRKSEFEYETDFYNEFIIAPAENITEKTRNWLIESGAFKNVLDAGSYIEPTHTLTANITALYCDFREASSPTATMEIRFFVIAKDAYEEAIVFSKTYNAAIQIKSNDTKSMIEAMDRCLKNILNKLDNDFVEEAP